MSVTIETNHESPDVGRPGNTEKSEPMTSPNIAAYVKYV